MFQAAGYYAPRVFGSLTNSSLGQKIMGKLSNPNHLFGLGDIAKTIWEIPAVKVGVIRFVSGIYDWIKQ